MNTIIRCVSMYFEINKGLNKKEWLADVILPVGQLLRTPDIMLQIQQNQSILANVGRVAVESCDFLEFLFEGHICSRG